jgi:hypothetical protein
MEVRPLAAPHTGAPTACIRNGVLLLLVASVVVGLWVFDKVISHGWLYFVPTPSFRDVPVNRGRLIDSFESYQTIDEVTRILNARGYAVSTMGDHYDQTFDLRHVVLLAENFRDRSTIGELRLVFLNDRLMGVSFYPESLDLYLNQLGADGLRIQKPQAGELPNRDGLAIGEHTHLTLGIGPDERWSVEWYDRRLEREYEIYWAKLGSD